MDQIARTKRLTNYPRHKPYPQATWTFWDITNGNDPKPKLVVPKQDNGKLNYEYVPKPNLFKPKITILKPDHGYEKKKGLWSTEVNYNKVRDCQATWWVCLKNKPPETKAIYTKTK
jgi:hypothetical protein